MAMFDAAAQPEKEIESFKGIIAWFHQSSLDLSEEYRRLEEQVANLNGELEKKNQELKISLREREEARAYLLSVLESLKAGVLVLDQGLRPTLANRRLAELTDKVDEEGVAQLLGDKLTWRLKEGKIEVLPLECERVLRIPSGETIPVHLTISEIITGESRSGYALVFQDISRLKRLEEEAARSRRLSALGEMAAEVAHQIRSPLGGIELYASLLKEKGNRKTKGLANEILTAVHRLFTTISHLLSFGAEPSIAADVLPVSSLLREVKAMSIPLFRGVKWKLEIVEEPGLPPLWGDRGLLAQALFNLVANAREATPGGGRVKVEARFSPIYSVNGRIHRAVEIEVTDEGEGIATENHEKIFDPFFTTKPNGTGLGLALTHRIISAHGGSIEISSEPDKGSQFTLKLPAVEEMEEYAEANCHSR